MSLINRTGLTVGVLAAVLAAANAQAEPERVGDWQVDTRAAPTGPIDPLCVLVSPTIDGVRFWLQNTPVGAGAGEKGSANFQLVLVDALSPAPAAEIGSATVSIPGQKSWTVPATYAVPTTGPKGLISFVLEPDIHAVLRSFRNGSKVDVEVPLTGGASKSFSVDLSGSAVALNAYRECLGKSKLRAKTN